MIKSHWSTYTDGIYDCASAFGPSNTEDVEELLDSNEEEVS